MLLKELKLLNFRRFKELNVCFHKRLTVIVGKNGQGKSTILDAAIIALSAFTSGFDGYKPEKIKKSDPLVKSFSMGSVVDTQKQFPVIIQASAEIAGRDVIWSRTIKNAADKGGAYKEYADVTALARAYQENVRKGDQSTILPVVAYYGTGRLWVEKRENIDPKPFGRVLGYDKCCSAHLDNQLLATWFKQMTIMELQQKQASPEFSAVRNAVAVFLKHITDAEHTSVGFDIRTDEIVVSYEKNGYQETLPLASLSDGFRCTLNLVADIAFRMAVLNPQLSGDVLTKAGGVVLIDEIDLHLHPAWQSIILSDLLKVFQKVQFIVTTHAPAVINSVSKENLIILEGESAERPAIQTFGKDANSILESVMNVKARPEAAQKLFDSFYKAIDENRPEKAKKQLEELARMLGDDDPELTACKVRLELDML